MIKQEVRKLKDTLQDAYDYWKRKRDKIEKEAKND